MFLHCDWLLVLADDVLESKINKANELVKKLDAALGKVKEIAVKDGKITSEENKIINESIKKLQIAKNNHNKLKNDNMNL